jgi:prepilin-type N-terminal cleavage/methylation domain-containing protein/prepilin-type processing-associated H-X9-DG protein
MMRGNRHSITNTRMGRIGKLVHPCSNFKTPQAHSSAFTLIEVLVVIGVIALLLSILLPSLSAARQRAKAVTCRSNIRQLAIANQQYANSNQDRYCPGAADFLANRHRWHGTRERVDLALTPEHGPLSPYLGLDGAIRQCPEFPSIQLASENAGFERGNGGYGYNNAFIGVKIRAFGSGEFTVATDRLGAMVGQVHKPAETMMFTDTAFASNELIEYSFAEPRYHPQYPTNRAVPSIHFRHRRETNVAWCDGHVDAHKLTLTDDNELYPLQPRRFDIGWFGTADDNSLFDLD